MRLSAPITAQPPVTAEPSHLAATHVDPIGASNVEQAAAGLKPWQECVSGVALGDAFGGVAVALIAVTGAIYVGMYHIPWVRNLASHASMVEQAGDATSMAMATDTTSAATPASTTVPAPTETTTPPASPDRVAAARDRMRRRIYSQVQQPRARTVVGHETVEENEVPAPSSPRCCYRSTRYMYHSASFNTARYKGA